MGDGLEREGILAVLRRWLAQDVLPDVLRLEHADEYPAAMVDQMREFGLFGATIPTEYGGLGFGAALYSEIVALISETWMSLTGVINSHLMMAELVRRYGTERQRSELLPRFAAGEYRGGLALTEPDAGTDLQAILPTDDAPRFKRQHAFEPSASQCPCVRAPGV
jgi:alkylation response protein AidB-like acyl-CoA dehydrogenase